MRNEEIAVELYKLEKVSLSRAAEIAGLSQEGFKDLLKLKGIKRVVAAPSEDEIRRRVDLICQNISENRKAE